MPSVNPCDAEIRRERPFPRQFVTGSDGVGAYVVDTVWQSDIDRVVDGSSSIRCKIQLAGQARYLIDKHLETSVCGTNLTFLHSPPGCLKRERVESGTCERSIVLILPIEADALGGCSREDAAVDRALREVEDRPILRQHKLPVVFGSLATSILDADRGSRHFEKLRRARVDELACMVLDTFLEQYAGHKASTITARERRQVDEAREILLSDLSSPPSLNALARAVGSNRTKLNHGFRIIFGESVFQLLQRERMLAARVLLQSGHHSVTEVAERCGYEYIGNFSLAFKSYFGVPPSVTLRQS